MRVTGYETFIIPPRWVFLKIETTEGIIGWGEPALEGRSELLCSAVSELIEDHVIGEDPTAVTNLWYQMYRGNHYTDGPVVMSAIAGIDQALWDIKGRALDEPVFRLLGGPVREKVRVYQWLSGDQPEQLAEAAREAVDDGYSTLGVMAHTRPARIETSEIVTRVDERISAIRDAIEPGVDLATDFRGRVSTSVARQLFSKLEQYNLMFIEEPVHPDYNGNLKELSKTSNTPIATGQRIYSRWGFRPLLTDAGVDIIQPAMSHAGGVTEIRNIAQMAEAFDVTLMPKCSVGPLSFAAAMHMQMAVPNAVLQEQHDEFYADQQNQFFNYIDNENYFTLEDGFMTITENSGLGLRMDEEYIREEAKTKTNWKGPTWQYEDGSVANW